jgi:predicted nucleic acid-binding protein
MARYYIDTCIWRDFLEDRISIERKPIGDIATKFLIKIFRKKDTILYSDLTIIELEKNYSIDEIENILKIASIISNIEKIDTREEEHKDAQYLSYLKEVPLQDALHAILARRESAILITRDKHFNKLKDIAEIWLPEDLI